MIGNGFTDNNDEEVVGDNQGNTYLVPYSGFIIEHSLKLLLDTFVRAVSQTAKSLQFPEFTRDAIT